MVDASMFGAVIELMREWVYFYASSGKSPSLSVLGTTSSPLWYFYRCKDDKWIVMSVLQPDRFWHDFCVVVGIEELENDAKFKDAEARRTNFTEIASIVAEKMVTKTSHYTQHQLHKLSELAQEEGVGEAALLREALDDLLRKYDGDKA